MFVKLLDVDLIRRFGSLSINISNSQARKLIELNKAKYLNGESNSDSNNNLKDTKEEKENKWIPPENNIFVKEEDLKQEIFSYPDKDEPLFQIN